MKGILLILFVIAFRTGYTQQGTITGYVVDDNNYQPLEGAHIYIEGTGISVITDLRGAFTFKKPDDTTGNIIINSIGYASRKVSLTQLAVSNKIALIRKQVELSDVKVVANSGDIYRPLSKSDIQLRGVSNSQEVLRLIPGLFIGQHQGGGKAEQIFLRGFDCDHGTDIALFADGMPINMVSHAHGQGYADSHFIIPETIEYTNFKKGPYYADKGDFATTGFADFNTLNALRSGMIRMEGGMFNTYRLMGMFNLLNEDARKKQQSWYAASEYRYTDSYFDCPQHFKRFNFFTKYNGRISKKSYLSLSASYLYSKWNASGQIPDRAVDKAVIGFYGSLDPNEGGITSLSNFNGRLITSFSNGDYIKNQVYYSHYNFDLYSNFTFYLVDTINGDEIRQKESRNMVGTNSSYNHTGYIGTIKLVTEAGVSTRSDIIKNSELSHTKNRTELIFPVKLGDIRELSVSPYLSETLTFNSHFSVNASLRFDQFYHSYDNMLSSDSTLPGIGLYKSKAHIVSPKLTFNYQMNDRLQFYLNTGRGFHSNDTRGVVIENGKHSLPAAYGVDLGTVSKPAPKLLITAALWFLYLDDEYVYGGDGGTVEFNGKTKRMGFDFSGRYEPVKSLYIDIDINYAHGRVVDAVKGGNYIPLAPVWSSTGGITYGSKNGLNGSLRYRCIGDRPANVDYSLNAKGYFITDAVINYTKKKYEIGLTINNVFNTKWKETQFATETRLKGELSPVTEICFTPGTAFAAKIGFTYFFK